MRHRQLPTVLFLLSLPHAAFAQSNDEDPNTVSTSARAPSTQFAVERSVSDVSAEEVRERQADTVTSAFEEEPGVLVQSTNRGAGTLIVRGLVGPENLIYFDGVRFSQSTFRTGPNQYTNTIDPWALERLELVRGPASVLYGSGAMGGALHLTPRGLPDETETTARAGLRSGDSMAGFMVDGGSSFDTVKGSALKARLGGTFRAHGDLRAGSDGGAIFPASLDGTEFLAKPWEEGYWRGGVGYDFGESTLRLNYFGGSVTDAMRLDRVGNGEVRVYDNQDHLTYLTWELDGPLWIDDFRINASWHRTVEDVTRWNCEDAVGPRNCVEGNFEALGRLRTNTDLVDTFGSSAVGISHLFRRRLTMTWGADAYADFVDSSGTDARAPGFEPDESGGNFASGSRYSTVGLFTLANLELLAWGIHSVRAHGGARVESHAAFAPDVTEELGDVSYSYTGVVGSAGLSFLSATVLNAYLNWNQGFRAPNLQEATVLGDTGNFFEVPNPDLKPERSDTFELGAKFEVPWIARLHAAAWVSLLSDRITREATSFDGASQIDDKEVRWRVNRDRAYFYGADLSAETTDVAGLSAYGNVSWIDGAVQADDPDDAFEPGPLHDMFAGDDAWTTSRRLPPTQYLAGLRFEPSGGAWVAFYIQGAAAQDRLNPDDRADLRICETEPGVLYDDVGGRCPGTAAWTTLNARMGFTRGPATVDVAATNLTDVRYRLHGSGIPAPGFGFAGQLTVQW